MSLIYSHLHESYGYDDDPAAATPLMATTMDSEFVSHSTSFYHQAFDSELANIKIPDFQDTSSFVINHQEQAAHQEPLELFNFIDQDLLLEDITKLLDESEQFNLNNNSDVMDPQSHVSSDLAVMTMELPDSPPLDSSSCYAISSPSIDSYNEDSLNEVISQPKRKSLGRVGLVGKVCKKESNREAANRYRIKKQRERDALFAECAIYDEKNNELRKKIDETQAEISIIKNLLLEALVTKN